MDVTNRNLVVTALLSAVLAGACSEPSGSDPAPRDAAVTRDATRPDRGAVDTRIFSDRPRAPKMCQGTSRCFVVDSISLPTTTTAKNLAFDIDGISGPENAFGDLIGALGWYFSGSASDLQSAATDKIFAGASVTLLRAQAASFALGKVSAQLWHGVAQNCCPGKEQNPFQCAYAARASCFNGSHAFTRDAKSPSDGLFAGNITARGQATFGPGKLLLKLPLGGAGIIELPLTRARVAGYIGEDRWATGIIGGAIAAADITKRVIPGVLRLLNNTIKNPRTLPSTKDLITAVFDGPCFFFSASECARGCSATCTATTYPQCPNCKSDDKIHVDELKNNYQIQRLLAPDLDLDLDGKKESMSLGIGFTAVSAWIF